MNRYTTRIILKFYFDYFNVIFNSFDCKCIIDNRRFACRKHFGYIISIHDYMSTIIGKTILKN